jgi:hypothetical protein
MLSHIVVKGNMLSKFAAWTRNIKAHHSEQSIKGSKCKQQVRLASMTNIPKNISLAVHGNLGFEILLKLFVKGLNS